MIQISATDGTLVNIESVGYWNKSNGSVGFITKDATNESLESFLSAYNGKGWNYIVTQKGSLYCTPDTPGYCDGEKTVTPNRIIEAMYRLPHYP